MRKPVLIFALLFLIAASGSAQKPEDPPGSLPVEQLEIFPPEKLSVEVNLEGALLRLVAEATKLEDPGFSAMIAGLKAIKVRVFPLAGVDAGPVKSKIGNVARWLEERGWAATVKVREHEEETYIYLKELDGKIAGLTVLSMKPRDEAVVINIVGKIDPAQLGRLAQKFDLPELPKSPAVKKPE